SAEYSRQYRVPLLYRGADDYLVKPFGLTGLLARVRALLPRPAEIAQSSLHICQLDIDFAARKVTRHGRVISLTRKEFALLEYLVRNRGIVLTRAMIAEHVWDQHFESFSNTID